MSTVSNTQRLTTASVHQIFRNLESGDGKGFFEHVAEDVDWIVVGTLDNLAKVLPHGAQLRVSTSSDKR
jgi:uncharacterized protein